MTSIDKPASEQIDNIISNLHDWRGTTLHTIRFIISNAAPNIIEEVKWKKPSKPEGIAVWTYNGKNICMADILKNAVRVTFPKGAQIDDPTNLFNTRLNSKTIRAIDFYEDASMSETALQKIVTNSLRIL